MSATSSGSYDSSTEASTSYESSSESESSSSTGDESNVDIFTILAQRTRFMNISASTEGEIQARDIKEVEWELAELEKERATDGYEERIRELEKRRDSLLAEVSLCENRGEYDEAMRELEEKQKKVSELEAAIREFKEEASAKSKVLREEFSDLSKTLTVIDNEISESKALAEKLTEIKRLIEKHNGMIPRSVTEEQEERIKELEAKLQMKKLRVLELEIGKSEEEINKEFSLYSTKSVDRSDWYSRLFEKYPEIQNLRERINPLRRAMAMAKYYSKSKVEVDIHLTQNVLNTLILQHLEYIGSHQVYDYLKKTLVVNTDDIMPLNHSRLMRLIEIAIRDTEQLYGLLLEKRTELQESKDDQEKTEDLDMSGINALISDIGLDQKLGNGDINIWDEPPDCPENIVYSEEDGVTVWYANENKLIEKLTSADTNAIFVTRFVMAYQSFMSNEYLFYKLQQRYNVPDMDHPAMKRMFTTEKEYLEFKTIVKMRVIAALDRVVRENFDDLGEKLILRIESFVHDVVLAEKGSDIVLKTIKKMRQEKSKVQISYDFDTIPQPILPSRLFSPKLDLNDIDEEEFARQITLYVFELYQKIKPSELITLAWSKKELQHRKAPNIMRMIAQFNNFSNWVTQSIVLPKRATQRASMYKRFVLIGKHCRKLKNFNTLMTLIAGIGDPSVNRLKYTLGAVKQNYIEMFDSFKELMDQKESYKNYKQELASVSGPRVPYVGVYLTDLTFKNDANPSKVNGLINFLKSVKLVSIIEEIKQYQAMPYNILPIDQIQWLLRREFDVLSAREIWAKSNEREPKRASKSKIRM